EDLNGVFLANSKEALWQISPVRGSSIFPTNTNEANILIIYTRFGRPFGSIKVNNDFFDSFDPNDNRRNQWISQFEDDLYYAFKYKVRQIYNDVPEYSMVLRLSEQYLIRAEARAHQNKLDGAIADIDRIRQRAGISLISEVNPGIGQEV